MKIFLALMSIFAYTAATIFETDLNLLVPQQLGEVPNKLLERFEFNTVTKYLDISHICLSPKCLRTASEVLGKMKQEVNPCDDFYQFACGGYIDKTQIPKNRAIMTEYIALAAKVEEQLKAIIKEGRPKTDPKYLKLPSTFYNACINTTLIAALGPKPMQRVATALGGWPVIVGDSWNSDNLWTWEGTVMKSGRLGLHTNYLLDVSISRNPFKRNKHIINLDKPSLGLRLEHWKNETLVYEYYDYMVDLAVLFGANRNTAKKELIESLQFERELAYISQTNGMSKYNSRSIKQLLGAYPYVQWLDYINGLLPRGLSVSETKIINLAAPRFFEDLENLLKITNKRTIANYVMWRIHESSVRFLSEKFRRRKLKFRNDLFGRQIEEPRWRECEQIVSNSLLKFAMNILYVHKYFSNDTEEIIWNMIDNIGGTFLQMIDEVNWMDEMTKQKAKDKLKTLTAQVGYPVDLLDHKKMEKFYRNLNIDSNKYFESSLKLNAFETNFSFRRLRRSVNYIEWFRRALPMVTNSYYSPFYNDMLFPAGILQGHFFNIDRPMYMNYGAIGSSIGHEFAHSLHARGHQYKNNLIDSRHPETQKAYLERVKCMIEQYGNYTDKQTGLNLNGINTQNENIADNIGIRQSYLAYMKWMARNKKEPRLPRLDYTPQQMFWISVAQTQCAKYTTGNLQEFAHDFQCPMGSPMNPVKKCQIW